MRSVRAKAGKATQSGRLEEINDNDDDDDDDDDDDGI